MSPFDPAAITAETAAFNAGLESALAAVPTPDAVPIALTRRARAEGKGIFPLAGPDHGSAWREIGAGRRVRLSPAPGGTPKGRVLHIHGGGWTFNAPHYYDRFNQRMAAATGAEVASCAYRLAPEHRWPAPLEDVLAAARWARAQGEGPLVIAGESAGAHLGLCAALALRDGGEADRLAGLVLTYGAFDLRGTPSLRNWGARYLILSTPVVDWFVGNLLGDHAPDDPAVSPLLADLAGLPPALIQIGTADPLLDDSLFLDARLRAAGGRSELVVYPGGVHAFDQFVGDLAIARDAARRQDAFVARCLGG